MDDTWKTGFSVEKIIILETGEEVASEKRDIVEIGKVEMVFVKCESEF